MTDSPPRSRNLARLFVQAQPDQLVSSISRQRPLLVAYLRIRSSNHISLRHSLQRHPALPSRYLRHCSTKPPDKLRPGLSRYHHLLRVCRYPWTHLILHYLGDFIRPSSRSEHRCRSRRLLCRGDSHDLPSLEDAQPNRMEPRRQVWLCLGKYRLRLLDDGLLLPS